MSKFKTSIPLSQELARIKKLLPPGAYFGGVVFDEVQGDVDLLWEYDTFQTPLDHAKEFPIANLEGKALPKGVNIRASDRVPETVVKVQPAGETPEGFKRVAYTIGSPRVVKVDFQPDVTQQDIGYRDVPADFAPEGFATVPSEPELNEALEAYEKAKAVAAAPAPIPETGAQEQVPAESGSESKSESAPEGPAPVMTPGAETVAKKGKRK